MFFDVFDVFKGCFFNVYNAVDVVVVLMLL
jgi:hypothetical protein